MSAAETLFQMAVDLRQYQRDAAVTSFHQDLANGVSTHVKNLKLSWYSEILLAKRIFDISQPAILATVDALMTNTPHPDVNLPGIYVAPQDAAHTGMYGYAHHQGPYIGRELYTQVPDQPLNYNLALRDLTCGTYYQVVTRGAVVGITLNDERATSIVYGINRGSKRSFPSVREATDYFNSMWEKGLVEVVTFGILRDCLKTLKKKRWRQIRCCTLRKTFSPGSDIEDLALSLYCQVSLMQYMDNIPDQDIVTTLASLTTKSNSFEESSISSPPPPCLSLDTKGDIPFAPGIRVLKLLVLDRITLFKSMFELHDDKIDTALMTLINKFSHSVEVFPLGSDIENLILSLHNQITIVNHIAILSKEDVVKTLMLFLGCSYSFEGFPDHSPCHSWVRSEEDYTWGHYRFVPPHGHPILNALLWDRIIVFKKVFDLHNIFITSAFTTLLHNISQGINSLSSVLPAWHPDQFLQGVKQEPQDCTSSGPMGYGFAWVDPRHCIAGDLFISVPQYPFNYNVFLRDLSAQGNFLHIITRGKVVGITTNDARATFAVTGVPMGCRHSLPSVREAVDYWNRMWEKGAIQVVKPKIFLVLYEVCDDHSALAVNDLIKTFFSGELNFTPHSPTVKMSRRPRGYRMSSQTLRQSQQPPPGANTIRAIDRECYILRIGQQCFECSPTSGLIDNPLVLMEMPRATEIEVLHVPEGMPLPLFRQRTDVGDAISGSAANAQAPAGHPLPSDNPPPYPAPSVQSGSTPGKGYVIFTGNQGGVYYNHEHVNRIVKNDTSTVYMSYPTQRRANDAWQYALAKGFATIGCAQALGRQRLQQLTQESYHLPSSATACLSPMSGDRYYVVMKGIRPGIYGSWVEAAIQVLGVHRTIYKALETYYDAENCFNEALHMNKVEFL
ncbi:hypothetical protein DL96DRAFT_1565613 [Flagelloscypha sp. PMI_526]|nr:hypothetical protein DL96DRAFT_1565613 [Flagelloscypha sp. PMI_526]